MLPLLYILCSAVAVSAIPACPGDFTGNSSNTLSLSPNTIAGLQLAAHLENLEVNFFQAGSANITAEDGLTDISNITLTAIRRATQEEEAHRDTIQRLLVAAGATKIPECNYTFPSTNTKEFIALGRSLSSVGLGFLLSLAESVAASDQELVLGIASIATTEARHDAFFNIADGKSPTPTSFDTPISAVWAYNLAAKFIDAGSCPFELPITSLPSLITQTSVLSNTSTLSFSWNNTETSFAQGANNSLYIAWVSQIGTPLYSRLNISTQGGGIASIPAGLNGAVFTALTSRSDLTTLDDLTAVTLAGPAVVLIDE